MICPNCGCERSGPYCGHCGQNDRDYRRSLPPVVAELLRETFDLDSRLLRTLSKLLCKPAELSVEFSRNRRARCVSPLRLYLFVSITFFILLSITTQIQLAAVDDAAVSQEIETVAGTDTGRLLQQVGDEQRKKAAVISPRC